MTTRIMMPRFVLLSIAALAAACSQAAEPATATTEESAARATQALERGGTGAVYTMTNAAAGNELVAFARARDGSLAPAGRYATGGAGSGDGLGSQGALARGGHFLFVVNAGSDDVSTFAVGEGAPVLVARTASGGTRPISVTVHHRLAYVLNAGDVSNVSGFWIDDDGSLDPIEGSTQPLSGANVGPAQASLDGDGDTLVVTEKGTSQIDAYAIDRRGRAHGPTVSASSGMTPFGFAFTPRNELVVSEAAGGAAGKSAVSAYSIRHEVDVTSVSASVPNGQTAACWLVVDADGRFAFTTNTGSGSLSAYRIDRGGRLALEGSGVAAVTGAGTHPIDLAFGASGRYLYALASGNGTVNAYEVRGAELTSVGAAGALPGTVAGLVAW